MKRRENSLVPSQKSSSPFLSWRTWTLFFRCRSRFHEFQSEVRLRWFDLLWHTQRERRTKKIVRLLILITNFLGYRRGDFHRSPFDIPSGEKMREGEKIYSEKSPPSMWRVREWRGGSGEWRPNRKITFLFAQSILQDIIKFFFLSLLFHFLCRNILKRVSKGKLQAVRFLSFAQLSLPSPSPSKQQTFTAEKRSELQARLDNWIMDSTHCCLLFYFSLCFFLFWIFAPPTTENLVEFLFLPPLQLLVVFVVLWVDPGAASKWMLRHLRVPVHDLNW